MLRAKMAELPTHLITEILSKLPVKSLLRFRSVAKSWRTLIDGKYFINLHLKNALQNPTHHTLIIKDCFLQDGIIMTNEEPFLYTVDYPALKRATLMYHPFDIASFEVEIVGSCHGLICLADGEVTVIFNPTTRKHRVLPVSDVDIPGYAGKLPKTARIPYGFGYDHVNDDYKLVRIVEFFVKNSNIHFSEVKVYSLKSNSWRKVRDFPSEYYIGIGLCWASYLNGCLHWVAVKKSPEKPQFIISFDIGREVFKVVPQPKYDKVTSDMFVNLGVLDGCLRVMALYGRVRTDVWIMKEYGVEKSWTKLFSVTQRESLGLPVAYLKKSDSEEVLFEQDFKKLVWFDVKSKRAKTVKTRGLPWSFDSLVLVESLVSLEIHKKKKKPKKKRNDSVTRPEELQRELSSLLASLPEKVLCHIFSQLPVKTLLRVQLVCKTWYNLINGSDFIKMHLEVFRNCNSGSSLIVKGDRWLSVNAQLLDKAIDINHPLLCSDEYTDIVGSCNGLICLCNDQNFALWNPYTGKHEKIPSPGFHLEHASNVFHCLTHGFGYDPTADDYKVVSILQQHNRLKGGTMDIEVQVYSSKTKSRKQIQQFSYFVCYPCYGVFTSGALHWVARQNPDLYSSSNLVIAFDLGVEKCRVVTQPNYVDTDFHMSLGLLGGSLCFLCHYPKESFDLWVMTDYQTESWTKLVSISQPNVISCFEYMKPLAYSEDGSQVLFEQDNGKLLWYNLRKKAVTYVKVPALPKAFDTVMCSSSLVPIGNCTRNYQVIQEQPPKGCQISKNNKERRDLDGFLSKGFKLKL
ncbi:hypothetical protein SOVF_127200 [Spinacia oleracea]|uniref:F-box protein CPR1 n=1 Tax=Spinacia oleracea TaxID=3562 RepID=A0A9R0IEU0_SPIOL|nr:F-box protein CPR1-like [Spinacia oleracea]KNA12204.1 hypothetical protein SOVF_127200 [Spinacia oleracea]